MLRIVMFLGCLTVFLFPTMQMALADDDLDAQRKEAREKISNKVAEINKNTDGDERTHFTAMYSNFNLIAVVKVVRDDIKAALDSCGENNPDKVPEYDEKFKSWTGSVDPVMEEAKAHLDNMVAVQDYASKEDIEELFQFIEDARALTDEQFKKIPVSSPEACAYLVSKMSDTQMQFTELLRGTLLSLPRSLSEDAENNEAAP